jgi:small subunit ribosomal protein S6
LRDYEILYIVRPDLDDEQLQDAVQKVTGLIENLGGSHQRTDVWGRRRLAYEVDRLREGHYVLTEFAIDPPRIQEMESTLKISETVFRHLITRRPPPKAAAAQPKATPPAEVEAPAPVVAEVAVPAEPEAGEPAAVAAEPAEPAAEAAEAPEAKAEEGRT